MERYNQVHRLEDSSIVRISIVAKLIWRYHPIGYQQDNEFLKNGIFTHWHMKYWCIQQQKKKTQTQRAVHIVSFHLYAVQEQAQLIYNDKSESGCLNDGRGYWLERDMRELSGVREIFSNWFWVMVIEVSVIVRIHQTEHLKSVRFIVIWLCLSECVWIENCKYLTKLLCHFNVILSHT